MSGLARTQARRLVAIVMVLGLTLAACSSSSDNSDGGGSTDTTTASGGGIPEYDPTGVVKVGYDLIAGQRKGFTFDPAKQGSSSADEGLYYAVYGRLMRPTPDGKLEPDLAESATIVDTNTIDVKLRPGTTFQDGTPFDAAAVKYGLERNVASGNTAAFTEPFFALKSVDVVSPTEVKLNIEGTAPSWYDSFMGTWPVTVVKEGTDFSKPVGAGPMQVTAFSPQTSMSLTKWDGYWDAENILPGGIELTNLVSDQTAAGVAALQAGQLDFVLANLEVLPSLTGDTEPVFTPDDSRLAMFQICKKDGPLSDVNVRKAINKAIDREGINEAVFEGTNDVATEPWPASSQFYDPALADVLAYDLDAAKELMAQSQYPNGGDVDGYFFTAAGSPEVAQVLKEQLKEIGINLNLIAAPNYTTDFLDPPKSGIGITPAIPAGRQRLNQWTGDQLSNACDYDNPELNALIAQLATVSDSDPKAVELWHEIDAIVVNNALHGFVTWGQNMIGYNTKALGEAQNFPDTNITFPDLRRTWVNP